MTYGNDHQTIRRPTRTNAFQSLDPAQQRQIERWECDGEDHNFADFNALARAATPLAGQFRDIPSGNIVPQVTPTSSGFELGAGFWMLGQFDDTQGGDVNTGEYRQYIYGTFNVNGVPHRHDMGRGGTLHPTIPREDCLVDDDSRYGYRGEPDDMSGFGSLSPVGGALGFNLDPHGRGAFFLGRDEPCIGGDAGDRVDMDLHFIGQLVDTSRPPGSPSYVVDQSQWQVSGGADF